jgi:hypothetical protein
MTIFMRRLWITIKDIGRLIRSINWLFVGGVIGGIGAFLYIIFATGDIKVLVGIVFGLAIAGIISLAN